MKRIALLVLVLAITAACDSESPGPPTKKEIADEVATGVEDELAKKGPKWKVDYRGDLSGHAEGGILVAMGAASSISAKGSGATKKDGAQFREALSLTILNANGDEPSPVVTLKLGDGTKCTNDNKKGFPELKLIDKEGKTFHAELEGSLVCGEKKDKSISFTAVMQK